MKSKDLLLYNRTVVARRTHCRHSEPSLLKHFKYFCVCTLRTGGRCELCVVASAALTKRKYQEDRNNKITASVVLNILYVPHREHMPSQWLLRETFETKIHSLGIE
jgi:hypothetical protein